MNDTLETLATQAQEVRLVIYGTELVGTLKPVGSSSALASPIVHAVNTFNCCGRNWNACFDGQAIHLPDSVGLRYIHLLLGSQGQGIHASRLVMKARGDSVDCRRAEDVGEECNIHGPTTDSLKDPILPSDALRRAKKVIHAKKKEAKELRKQHDPTGAEAIEDEIERIEEQLKKHTFRRQSAQFSNRTDRDRKSVSNAITRALDPIGKAHAKLAWHLHKSIRSGVTCSYRPAEPTEWAL